MTTARRVRQDILRRYDDSSPLARQPRIDAAIGGHELGIADVVLPLDVEERVGGVRRVAVERAEDRLLRREWKFRRHGGPVGKSHRGDEAKNPNTRVHRAVSPKIRSNAPCPSALMSDGPGADELAYFVRPR